MPLLMVVLAAAGWAASVTAAGPPRADKPIQAICAAADGTYFGPNAVVGIDTTGFTNAGYYCQFDGPASGGTFIFSEALTDPETKRIRKLCAAAGGNFYLFERRIGPTDADVLWGGWGCSWLA